MLDAFVIEEIRRRERERGRDDRPGIQIPVPGARPPARRREAARAARRPGGVIIIDYG